MKPSAHPALLRPRRSAPRAQELSSSILNSLLASVAVIDSDGVILATNKQWLRIASEYGNPSLTNVGPGTNYLQICRRAAVQEVPDAQEALNGITAVLKGKAQTFDMEYPCPLRAEQSWFVMSVSPLEGKRSGAVIAHWDITGRKNAELSAQRNQSAFRALMESSVQSIVMLDFKQIIQLLNGRTEQMFGYTGQELLGRELELLIPGVPRAIPTERQCHGLSVLRTMPPIEASLDLNGRRKDGTTFPIELCLSIIETDIGKRIAVFVTDITERRSLELAGQSHAREIEALAAKLLIVQEEERARVARELHDQICQQLASIAIEIGSLAVRPPVRKDAPAVLRVLQEEVIKASEQARHIAYELHPSVLDDLGLQRALRSLCSEFSRRCVPTELVVKDRNPPATIPREIASCVYRVTTECLQNIQRHAAASHVSVTFDIQDDSVMLAVEDDGVGFDLQAVRGGGALGIIGMEERARLLSGTLSIQGRPGRGTRVALRIPSRFGIV